MLLWFCAMSCLIVWFVFRDPSMDYRLVMVGAVAPDVIDGLGGGARGMHSVTAGVIVLVVVVLATPGRARRARRKRWLAVPIGMFLHLLLDGAFTDTKVFWWPVTGWAFTDAALPTVDRGLGFGLALELAGLGVIWWGWQRCGLHDPRRRAVFVRSGRLALVGGPARR